MWHTDAIDTFDDYFCDSSHFFDTKNQTWISSISISYWNFKKPSKENQGLFDESRDSAPFPPPKVVIQQKEKVHWWKTSLRGGKYAKNEIEEGSSSLIILREKSGNFWTCSVVSPVLSEIAMSACVQANNVILEQFVHQASTGRCLIFLVFLGALCESLSEQYEDILEKLTKEIRLGVRHRNSCLFSS
jgi:hypothetical protein